MYFDPTTPPPNPSNVESTENSRNNPTRTSSSNDNAIRLATRNVTPIHERIWTQIETSARNFRDHFSKDPVPSSVMIGVLAGGAGGAIIAHYAGMFNLESPTSYLVGVALGGSVGGVGLPAGALGCMRLLRPLHTGQNTNDMQLQDLNASINNV